MNEEAPYQNPQLDKIMHETLRDMDSMLFAENNNALKNIALVGMLLPDNPAIGSGQITKDDIYREDSAMLRRSFNVLSKAGIALHPEARFQIYNILPPVRSDFLLAALDYECLDYPKNDLSILMYLPKYGTTPRDRLYQGNKGFKSFDTEELFRDQSWRQFTSASYLHHEFQIWADAADKLGSKLVLTCGGIDDEVTTQHFEGHRAFTTVIDSEENQRKKGMGDRNNIGVVMRKDYREQLEGFIKPDSEIGAALAHALG